MIFILICIWGYTKGVSDAIVVTGGSPYSSGTTTVVQGNSYSPATVVETGKSYGSTVISGGYLGGSYYPGTSLFSDQYPSNVEYIQRGNVIEYVKPKTVVEIGNAYGGSGATIVSSPAVRTI